MDKIFEITTYSVSVETDDSSDNLYYGIDKAEAQRIYKGIDVSDLPERAQDYGGTASFQEKTDKYQFIHELSEDESIDEYPIEDFYEDTSFYELIEEGDFDPIETFDITGKDELLDDEKEKANNILDDVVAYFKKKYAVNEKAGHYVRPSYYFIIPIGGTQDNIELRISNHSLNPSNIESNPNIVLDSELVNVGNKPKKIDISDENFYEVEHDPDIPHIIIYKQTRPKNRYALLSAVIFYSDNETQGKFDNSTVSFYWEEKEYDLSEHFYNSDELKEEIENEIKNLIDEYKSEHPIMKKAGINLIIGDAFFKEHPEKILGKPYEASGRFGKVTKYKGDISSVERIDAPLDFIDLNKADNPTESYQEQSIEQMMLDPQKVQNIQKSLDSTAKENAIISQNRKKHSKTRIVANRPLTGAPLFSFEQVFSANNPEISTEELKVFLWHKWKIGEPVSEKWQEFAKIVPSEIKDAQITKWVKEGLLFYFRGDLLPEYLYVSGNIWEKDTALKNEKEAVVSKYGQEVFDKQLELIGSAFKISYDKRLTLTNASFENRLKILPISNFSNKFMVKSLMDEKEFKAKKQPAGGKRPGRPDFLHTGGRSWNLDHFEELSLTEAFCYWLVNYRNEYEIKRDISYAEIIDVYVFQRSRPAIAKITETGDKKEAEAIWQRKVNLSKEEGDRLFSIFLAEWITANDIIKIETTWNEKYNGHLPINYNKIPVAFTHATEYRNALVDIRPEKREAVAFIMNEGSGCLAYDVGVGKTWSALFTVKQFIESGYCKRPFLVVPNQTYKQWLAEGRGLLPDVKFNDLYNLSEDYINDLRGPDGHLELVDEGSISVMTYEGFEQIGFSESTSNEILAELYGILDQDPEGKKKEKQEAALQERLKMLIGRGLKGTLLNIEDLGFDFACYDEAHKMKKVFVGVRGEMKGDGEREKNPYQIQSGGAPSSIALKGFMISQYILRRNNYRNILTLTATPFTNSPLEIFSVLSFIAYHKLRDTGLNNLKTFFDNYVHATNELVINAKLKPERKQVVLGFNNLKSLQQLIRRFINYKTGEMVRVKRPNKYVLPYRSKVINGEVIAVSPDERIDTSLPLSPLQQRYMDQIKEYAEGKTSLNVICSPNSVSDRHNKVTEEDDEHVTDSTEGVELDEDSLSDDEKAGVRILRSMNYARNLALSPYLFECAGLGKPTYLEYIETSPKLMYTMLNIKSVKKWHEKSKTPISGQIIYMDRGIEYFELIKEYLVKEIGYKPHEVGIIRSQMPGGKDAKEIVKMSFLGEAYDPQSGEVIDIPDEQRMKIVIGSSTIKEGINLQKHTTNLYNLWVDWNPTDIKQLEGRSWRQGNLFRNTRITTPLMQDSMDIFIFQKLEEKTKRISEIWDSDGETNTFNLQEFNPSEIKSSLISDPKVLAELELMENKEKIQDDIRSVKNEISRIDKITQAHDFFLQNFEDFREWVAKYRPVKKGKDDRSFETLRVAMDDVLKKQTDKNGKKMESSYFRKPNVEYSEESPAYKPYDYDKLNLANRLINSATKDYLVPKGLKIEKLPKYKGDLLQKVEHLEKIKTEATSEETVNRRAAEIIEDRKRNKTETVDFRSRSKQWEKLNYLLDDKQDVKPKTKPTNESQCPPVDEQGVRRTDREALELISHCIAKQPQTKEHFTDKSGKYTAERKALHDRIIKQLTQNATCIRRDKPIAVLTGGAPGSGKTHFLKHFAPYLLSKEIFHIDADEVREKLPEYKGWNSVSTHLETRDIVENLLDDIGKEKCQYDVVYDGTMNKAKRYYPLINKLNSLGYQVFIIYIEVPQEISEKRVLDRYQRTGRYVPVDIVQEVYDHGHEAFDQIKTMVSGWILVDGVEGKVTDRGGSEIPTDRDYSILSKTNNVFHAKGKGKVAELVYKKTKQEFISDLRERKADKAIHADIFQGVGGYNVHIFDNTKTIKQQDFETHELAIKFLEKYSAENGKQNLKKYDYGTTQDISNLPHEYYVFGNIQEAKPLINDEKYKMISKKAKMQVQRLRLNKLF